MRIGIVVMVGQLAGCIPTDSKDGESGPLIAWTKVASIEGYDLDPDGYEDALPGVIGDTVYFGPRTNVPSAEVMLSFDAGTESFGGPWATPPLDVNDQNDFCACGYTAVFVSGGDDLYLLGNGGMTYTPATDTWEEFADYGDYARGESAATHDGGTGDVLLLGGRDTTTSVLSFDPTTSTFADEGSTLPGALESGGATTPEGGTTTYAAGGDDCEGCLYAHESGTTTWTTLAEAPDTLGRNAGMGSFDGWLWYASSWDELWLYDPDTDTWEQEAQPVPSTFYFAVEVAGETWAIATSGTTIEAYQMSWAADG